MGKNKFVSWIRRVWPRWLKKRKNRTEKKPPTGGKRETSTSSIFSHSYKIQGTIKLTYIDNTSPSSTDIPSIDEAKKVEENNSEESKWSPNESGPSSWTITRVVPQKKSNDHDCVSIIEWRSNEDAFDSDDPTWICPLPRASWRFPEPTVELNPIPPPSVIMEEEERHMQSLVNAAPEFSLLSWRRSDPESIRLISSRMNAPWKVDIPPLRLLDAASSKIMAEWENTPSESMRTDHDGYLTSMIASDEDDESPSSYTTTWDTTFTSTTTTSSQENRRDLQTKTSTSTESTTLL